MRYAVRTTVTFLALAVLAATLLIARAGAPDTSEASELRGTTRARIESQRILERTGETDVSDALPGPKVTVPGWGYEQVFSRHNDWEPNVAADPSAPYVYMLTTEYGGPEACGTCPSSPVIRMRISDDGGDTFGPATFLCPCPGRNWQADPIINTDAAGNVYAVYLTSPFGTVFQKSTDHGVTWTDPVAVAGSLPWNDHPWMAVSSDGMDIYVGVNHRDNFQVSSHDGGLTWSEPVQTNTPGDYYFALGGEVLPNGDVVFVDAAFNCCGKGTSTGPVDVVVIRSTDGGATWTEQIVDTSAPMPYCTSYGCPLYQYGTEVAIAQNADGRLLIVYTAARRPKGGERVYTRFSDDNGVTWSPAARQSPLNGVIAAFPQATGGSSGQFAIAWADNRKGNRRFNTWVRESSDGGVSFGTDAQISNLGHGAGYKHPNGYQFSYGDYFDITRNSSGELFSAWGESYNYWGPGGTWYNKQYLP